MSFSTSRASRAAFSGSFGCARKKPLITTVIWRASALASDTARISRLLSGLE